MRGGLPSVSIYGDNRVQGTWPVAAGASGAPHLYPSRVQTLGRHCPLGCQIKSGNSLNPVEQADFFWEMLVSMFCLLGFPGLRGGLWQRFPGFVSRRSFVPGRKGFEETDSLRLKRDSHRQWIPMRGVLRAGGALGAPDHWLGAAQRDRWDHRAGVPTCGHLPGPMPPGFSEPENAVLSRGPTSAPRPPSHPSPLEP